MATNSNNTGVQVTKKNLQDVIASVRALAASEVLVGVPEEKTERDDGVPLTNAALAYIHDNGAPEAHIPARPFMVPGIKRAEAEIEKRLSMALKAAMRGNMVAAEGQMMAAGLAAQLGIQKTINDGIPPPLAIATLKKRAAKGRKGAQYELKRRAKGLDPIAGMQLAKPLVDTGELRKSITFVIRSRKARRG